MRNSRRTRAEVEALRRDFNVAHNDMQTSWKESLVDLRDALAAERDESRWRLVEHQAELSKALERVADALDGVAARLDADRRERAAQLEAFEFLLRELVIGLGTSAPSRSTVVGGSIDPGELAAEAPAEQRIDVARALLFAGVPLDVTNETSLDLTGAPLAVGVAVEVLSRFHDRWVAGFEIAEVVHEPDRCRYRLTRQYDREPLPLLFDPADVRRAGVPVEID